MADLHAYTQKTAQLIKAKPAWKSALTVTGPINKHTDNMQQSNTRNKLLLTDGPLRQSYNDLSDSEATTDEPASPFTCTEPDHLL